MSTASSQPSQRLEPLLFNNLASRQVVSDFSAGHLSTDGGILLLRQIDEGLGISRKLAGCFHDQRDPLFAVAVGKEDPLGMNRAPQDQGKALASASTLNRLELGNNKHSRCHKI